MRCAARTYPIESSDDGPRRRMRRVSIRGRDYARHRAAHLALCGCAYTVVHNGTVNQTKAQEVKRHPGFPPTELHLTVPLVLKTRDRRSKMMRKEIARDHSEDEIRIGGSDRPR